MMDLDLLIFKAVADKGSFSSAAKELHMTQPAVSFHIQALEESLGAKLFDRSNKRVILTAAGRAFYAHAKKILSEYEEARKAVLETTGLISGTLSLSASLTIGEYMAPGLIGKFIQKYPDVKFLLQIENTEKTAKMVLDKSIDIGLVEGPVEEKALDVIKLYDDELVVIFPKKKNEERDLITIDDFLRYPLIMRERGSGTRRVFEDVLKSHGINPESLDITLELGSNQAIKEAVIAGLGISVLSKIAITRECKYGLLNFSRIKDLSFFRTFNIIINKNKILLPVEREFIKFAVDYGKTI
ncbi:selenium metabolism-associated LysR family transcriptional regulator [Caldanaerobius fijiensis]|uniref:selenium metabolism-associated LysR family transcriptional regulator n=1 Tax=Caldanaerobius fijiensis TaxID=456330 RepID=UPI0009324C42|nr:selenium metabolism-associated LysR family transcriptional regulator [Caldanaerobius fijiensis]